MLTPMRELRVLVVGSSTTYMTVPHRSSRHDGTYAEHLDAELAALGVTARTTLRSRWHGMINGARKEQESLRETMPDVVVLNYGIVECQPRVLPTWFYRSFVTWLPGTRRHEIFYRRTIMPRLWRLVRSYQRLATTMVASHTHRLSPRRFDLELRKTIEGLRLDLAPLILVLDIDPVTAKVEHFIPGMQTRVQRYNSLLRAVVEDMAQPDTRLLRTSEVVHNLGVEVALPDGIHRSSAGHRAVAAMIATEIAPWAKATFA